MTPLGEDVLLLARIAGREELGRLFEYQLDLLSDDAEIKLEDLIGNNATVRIETPGGETRYINGFVIRFVQTGFEPGAATYEATLVPWLWFLTRTTDCRIFQNANVPDIIKQVFRERGFSDFEDLLSGTYPEREFCVQYNESEFDFVSRLMEHEGIYYYFKHENGKHTLVLADAPSAHGPAQGAPEIRFHLKSEGELAGEFIHEWTLEKTAQSGRYSVNDFDFVNPGGVLESKSANPRPHAAANFEVYDYPGCFTTTGEGERYARVRLEELHARYERTHGATDERALATGCTFTLVDHPRADQNREYLVLATDTAAAVNDYSTGGEGDEELSYECTFTAAPSQQPFRSPRLTPDPVIQGPQTAIVVGKQGEEIWTDEHGRVKVQFHWDRNCPADENSSCWVRVAQTVAGKKWGGIFLPRIGQEVIVEFLEGDPDRPIITGRVYNGQNKPPYDLPDMATISGLKSNSSKGGGGFNEIRFQDLKDEEQVFIHAQKNMDCRVLNDAFEWVGNDRHLIVKNNQLEHVENNRSEDVGADHMEAIGKDRHLKVTGKEAKQVGGSLSLIVTGDVVEVFKASHSEQVTQNLYLKAMGVVIEASSGLTLKCGGNSVVIDASGVTVKGSVVTLDGSMTKINSGPGSPPSSGQAGSAVSPASPEEALEADNADPGEVEQAKARERQSESGKYGSTPVRPFKPPEHKEGPRTWVEVELLDNDGNPVPGERYSVKLPDGSVQTGTLDQQGKARVEGVEPGSCEITFPEYDRDTWSA